MSFLTSPAASKIGILLTRVIVPLWVLAGAAFKLAERTPKLLPKNIWQTANDMGVNLLWLLAVIVALELFAVGVMFFLRRLARPMATFMLGSFCLILIGEIAVGNEECGCLGKYSFSPWVMLAIDGVLLLGVLLMRPRYGEGPLLPKGPLAATLAWTIAGAAVCTIMIAPIGTGAPAPDPIDPGSNGDPAPTGTTGPTGAPVASRRVPQKLPDYYVPSCDEWVGKRWDEIPLARFMAKWPADIEIGRRYVIFYGRTCDHCELLFNRYFRGALPAPTTVVAVPETPAGFETGGRHPMNCAECEEMALPIGCDWIITTPIVVALEDGVVTCAIEGEDPEDPQCLEWH